MLAAPAWAVDEVFQQTYRLQAGGTFLLTNVNGSVHVSGWDRNEVEVHAVKTALGAQRDLARVRKHGTTQERPVDRMDQERPYLLRLPSRPFVAARVQDRLVGYDFCVAWDTNRYSVSPSFVGRSVRALVLDGILDICLDGEIIASHRVRDTRHKRYVLPEHEAEFRQHSTSRHVLQEQFLRLGEVAQTFTDGLVKAHGGAAGYHISEILKLADQVGVPRVLEALRHAARYGAFGHTSVARIVRGKRPGRPRPSSFPSEPVPQHVAEYL